MKKVLTAMVLRALDLLLLIRARDRNLITLLRYIVIGSRRKLTLLGASSRKSSIMNRSRHSQTLALNRRKEVLTKMIITMSTRRILQTTRIRLTRYLLELATTLTLLVNVYSSFIAWELLKNYRKSPSRSRSKT